MYIINWPIFTMQELNQSNLAGVKCDLIFGKSEIQIIFFKILCNCTQHVSNSATPRKTLIYLILML